MLKFFDWIKSHKALTVLIATAVFLLPLVCVHVAYKINAVSPFFVSTWDSGNLITYIAGFEAFLGSFFLGGVAVYQNKKANELNARMLENEEKRDAFERQPSVLLLGKECEIAIMKEFAAKGNSVFQCASIPFQSVPNKERILALILRNTSRSYTVVNPLSLKCLDPNGKPMAFHCNMRYVFGQEIDLISIEPGEVFKIYLGTSLEKFEEITVAPHELKLELTNSLGETRKVLISFTLIKLINTVFSMSHVQYSYDE